MMLFADNGLTTWDIVGLVAIFAGFIAVVVILIVFVRFFRLWVQSATTGAGIGFLDMLGMTFRKVPPEVIVRSKIIAVQSGLTEADTGMTTRSLEAHYLARGNVPKVVRDGRGEEGQDHQSGVQAGHGHRSGWPGRAGGRANERVPKSD